MHRPGCFPSCQSASTAGLWQCSKTCELQMLGHISRTCAAGLRHSVRPANCKRSPLTGRFCFFPFSFFHICRFRVTCLFLAAGRPFSSSKGRLQMHLCYFSLLLYVRLHSQPPALLQSLLIFFFLSSVANLHLFCARCHYAQVVSCVGNPVTKGCTKKQGAEGPSLAPQPTKTASDRARKHACE